MADLPTPFGTGQEGSDGQAPLFKRSLENAKKLGESLEKASKILKVFRGDTADIEQNLSVAYSDTDKIRKGTVRVSLEYKKLRKEVKGLGKDILAIFESFENQNIKYADQLRKTINISRREYSQFYTQSMSQVRSLNAELGRSVFSSSDYLLAATQLASAGISNIKSVQELNTAQLMLSNTLDGWGASQTRAMGEMYSLYRVNTRGLTQLGDSINKLSELDGVMTSNLLNNLSTYSAVLGGLAKIGGRSVVALGDNLVTAASYFDQMYVDSTKVLTTLKALYQSPLASWNSDIYMALNGIGLSVNEFRSQLNQGNYEALAQSIVSGIQTSSKLAGGPSSEMFKIYANRLSSLGLSADDVTRIWAGEMNIEDLTAKIGDVQNNGLTMEEELKETHKTVYDIFKNSVSTNVLLTGIQSTLIGMGLSGGMRDLGYIGSALGRVGKLFNGLMNPNVAVEFPEGMSDAARDAIWKGLEKEGFGKIGLKSVAKFFSSHGATLGSVFQILATALPFVISIFQMFSKDNSTRASGAMGLTGAAIGTAIAPGIGTIIGFAIGEVLSKFMSEDLKNTIGEAVGNITEPFFQWFKDIKDVFSRAWESVKNYLSGLANFVGSIVSVVMSIHGFFNKVFGAVRRFIWKLNIEPKLALFKKIYDWLGKLFNTMAVPFKWLSSKINSFANVVTSGIGKLYNGLSALVKNLTFGLVDLGSWGDDEDSKKTKLYGTSSDYSSYYMSSNSALLAAIYKLDSDLVSAIGNSKTTINIPKGEDDGRVIYKLGSNAYA